jgi:FtsZ-interacting cell division protein ZipA
MKDLDNWLLIFGIIAIVLASVFLHFWLWDDNMTEIDLEKQCETTGMVVTDNYVLICTAIDEIHNFHFEGSVTDE